MMKRELFPVVFVVCLVAWSGCLQSDGKFEIKGTVTYDGQAVDDGMVTFMPFPGAPGTSESASIKDGGFSVRLPEGQRTVEVYGYRLGPAVVMPTGGASQPSREQYIPEAYNAKSELTLTVVKGMAPVTYDLKQMDP